MVLNALKQGVFHFFIGPCQLIGTLDVVRMHLFLQEVQTRRDALRVFVVHTEPVGHQQVDHMTLKMADFFGVFGEMKKRVVGGIVARALAYHVGEE